MHTLWVEGGLSGLTVSLPTPAPAHPEDLLLWREPLLAHSIHFSKDRRSGSRHYLNTVEPSFKNTHIFNAKKIVIETN